MPNDFRFANLILCQAVLSETSGMMTPVRVINFFTIPSAGNQIIHFYSLGLIAKQGLDSTQHTATVRMENFDGVKVAEAPEHKFFYAGYEKNHPEDIGGFTLTTEFRIDCSVLRVPHAYRVVFRIDEMDAAHTLLMLKRP